jgi:hypothetical protein
MMPTDPQQLSAAERDAIQDVLAVDASHTSWALRRYEATLRMLDVEVADIIRTQRAQIAALEAERDAQAVRLAAVETALRWAVETLDGYQAEIPGTEHWMTGWADWLERQARPALKGAHDA